MSELAEALRDSDDAKKQASKELNELRQLQLGVALSKDSAIDIMEEFETVTKTVKLVGSKMTVESCFSLLDTQLPTFGSGKSALQRFMLFFFLFLLSRIGFATRRGKLT